MHAMCAGRQLPAASLLAAATHAAPGSCARDGTACAFQLTMRYDYVL